MLWIEPETVVYAAIFGALVGSAMMAYTYRRGQRESMKTLESYWNDDIKRMMLLIHGLQEQFKALKKLSPKSVGNSVKNQGKPMKWKDNV